MTREAQARSLRPTHGLGHCFMITVAVESILLKRLPYLATVCLSQTMIGVTVDG